MEVWSLVLSIIGVLFSAAGIVVSILCWRHTYQEVKALKNLRAIEFNEEHCFTQFNKFVLEYLEANPNAENPFDFYSKDTATVIKACLFNMIRNHKSNMLEEVSDD